MKDWYPHKQYLKKRGVAYKDYPEEIRFQELVLKIGLHKKLLREIFRRSEYGINLEKSERLMRDIRMYNVGVRIN